MNGWFKKNLAAYKGEYTDKAIRKLSRGSNIRDKIVKNFHSSTKAFKRSGKHVESEAELKKKLTALVNQLRHENLYSDIPGRNYSSMYVSAEMLQESYGTANTRGAKKIDEWGTKHYYRYQNKFCDDDDNWNT